MRGSMTSTLGLVILVLIVVLMLMVFVCSAGGEAGESVFCQPFMPVIDMLGLIVS
jgi:hypothetical protein